MPAHCHRTMPATLVTTIATTLLAFLLHGKMCCFAIIPLASRHNMASKAEVISVNEKSFRENAYQGLSPADYGKALVSRWRDGLMKRLPSPINMKC